MMVVRNWWVVFQRYENRAPWWRPYVKSGWEHAWLLGFFTPGHGSIALDCAKPGIQLIQYSENDTLDVMRKVFRGSIGIISVEGVRLNNPCPPFVYGVRCVRNIKRVTGLRGTSVTPYRAFCALRKKGHEVIVGPNKG